ncbi:Hypothetical protein D9617_3g019800 [Elsinoe fawcettii]|nr:Hypothetical protein D9617_3g019800 [Elsinoe fawcettii]
MHYSYVLALLVPILATADNKTWVPPVRFDQQKETQQDIQASATSLTASTTTLVDNGRPYGYPMLTITTTLGYSQDYKKLLPNVPSDRFPIVSSLMSCMEANGEYTRTANATTLSIRYLTIPGYPIGRSTILWANEYTYTGCDGVPRVTFSGGTPSGSIYSMMLITPAASTMTIVDSTLASPPCSMNDTIVSANCPALATLIHDMNSKYSSGSLRGTIYRDLDKSFGSALSCNEWYEPSPSTYCSFGVTFADLFVWPETAYQNVSLCGPTITLPPAAQTATYVVDGMTFISPSVYVSYGGLSYTFLNGSSHTSWSKDSTWFSYQPSDVSSVCRIDYQSYPYNFRDLYGEVPWSAWACAKGCPTRLTGPNTYITYGLGQNDAELYQSYCRSIDVNRFGFGPVLEWPKTFDDILESLHGPDGLGDCVYGYWEGGIFDPPRTLSKTAMLTTPAAAPSIIMTVPAAPTPEPALPSSPFNLPAASTTHLDGPKITGHSGDDPSRSGGDEHKPSSVDPGRPESGLDPSQQQHPHGGADPSDVQDPSVPITVSSARGTGNVPPAAEGGHIGGIIASVINIPPWRPQPIVPGGVIDGPAPPVPLGRPQLQPTQMANAVEAVVNMPAAAPLTVVRQASNAYVIGSDTFRAGEATALPNGHIMTFGADAVIVDGVTTIAFAPASAPTLAAISSHDAATSDPVIADGRAGLLPQSIFVQGVSIVLGQTVRLPGGRPVSYTPAGITVGDQSFELPPSGQTTSIIVLSDGSRLSVVVQQTTSDVSDPAAVVIDGQVIPTGGVVTIKGGIRVSYGPNGLVIGSSTVNVPTTTSVELVTLDNGRVLTISDLTAMPTWSMMAEVLGHALEALRETGNIPISVSTTTMSLNDISSDQQPQRTSSRGQSDGPEHSASAAANTADVRNMALLGIFMTLVVVCMCWT